jgi:hypothetical protein
MFLVNTYQWQWTTIAALVAPRPLLFANSDNDRIFPMDGNRRIIARLRALYKMYGKPELVDEYISKGGHDDRPDLRVAAFRWMNKHLKNDTAPVKHTESKPLPGKELRVFPEDKDVPKDALNAKIDQTFVPKAVVKLPEEGKFEEWKKGLIGELRARSFRTFPERIPAGKTGSDRAVLFHLETEPGIAVQVMASKAPVPDGPPKEPATLIVLNPGDKLDGMFNLIPKWAMPYVKARVIVVSLRGGDALRSNERTAPTNWARKSPPNYVERSFALLGSTVDTGRVRDIAATARWLDDVYKGKYQWRVIGRDQAGVLAAYAALFEPSIQEVVLVDPPASHRDGPIFLNVLRVLDVPEALGLLAPRRLTLVNARDKAFDRTAQIYKRAGAADRLQRK